MRGSKQTQVIQSPHVRIELPSMLHEPDYWKNVLIIVPIVCTAFATLCFILRIYSRLKVLRGLRVEDVLMGVGLILTSGVAACIVYCESTISL